MAMSIVPFWLEKKAKFALFLADMEYEYIQISYHTATYCSRYISVPNYKELLYFQTDYAWSLYCGTQWYLFGSLVFC